MNLQKKEKEAKRKELREEIDRKRRESELEQERGESLFFTAFEDICDDSVEQGIYTSIFVNLMYQRICVI